MPDVVPAIAAALASTKREPEREVSEARLPSVWDTLGAWGR